MVKGRGTFTNVTCTPTGKKPLGRTRHRWQDMIRMKLKEVGINTGNFNNSAQDRDYWRPL